MSNGLKEALEIILFVLIASVLVASGAYGAHVIDAKKLATVQASYATQESARNQKLLSDYASMTQQRDAANAQIAANEQTNLANIQKANDETNQLRSCISNGNGCGLRVHTVQSTAGSGSAASAVQSASGVSAATYTELAPDAQQSYFTLRDAIDSVMGMLATCQNYAQSMVPVKKQ